MIGTGEQARTGGWNLWRIARWAAACALLLTPLVMMQFNAEWNWGVGDFLVAGIAIGGVGLLYELAERANQARPYRAGAGVALAASFLIIWTTLVRDDGNGMGFFLVIMAAAVGGFAVRFRPAGMARTMAGIAIMQALLGLSIATAPATASVPGGRIHPLVFNGVFALLWLIAASLFRAAAKRDFERS